MIALLWCAHVAAADLEAGADAGQLDADAWYDLGVVRLRDGQPAGAVAALRRAAVDLPRDADVLAALALARSRLEGAVPPPVPPQPLGWLLAAWEAVALGAAVAFAASWVRHGALAAVGWCLGAALAGAGLLTSRAEASNPVVVAVAEGRLRDAPRTDAAELAALAPGAEVRRRDVEGPWWLVEQGDGRRGWVPAAVFGPISGR